MQATLERYVVQIWSRTALNTSPDQDRVALGVRGLGFRVWLVQGLEGGARVSGFGLFRGCAFKERVSASLRVSSFWVSGVGVRVPGFGFRVPALGFWGYALKERVRFLIQDSGSGFRESGTCFEGVSEVLDSGFGIRISGFVDMP
jgi:hypothetical protein